MARISRLLKENWSRYIMLYLFWLLLVDSFALQQLLTGALCCLVIVAFSSPFRLPKTSRMALNTRNLWQFLLFGLILVKEIFLANIEVAKILLSKDMNISPTLSRFNSRLKKPFLQVVLANAITLTPGTLTVSLDEDVFLVHCLTEKGAYEVAEWPLKYRLQNIEKEGEW